MPASTYALRRSLQASTDGARTQQLTYDALGAVASEVTVMNLHNGPSAPLTTATAKRFAHNMMLTINVLSVQDEVPTRNSDMLSHAQASK